MCRRFHFCALVLKPHLCSLTSQRARPHRVSAARSSRPGLARGRSLIPAFLGRPGVGGAAHPFRPRAALGAAAWKPFGANAAAAGRGAPEPGGGGAFRERAGSEGLSVWVGAAVLTCPAARPSALPRPAPGQSSAQSRTPGAREGGAQGGGWRGAAASH